jgi:hypothetical protein
MSKVPKRLLWMSFSSVQLWTNPAIWDGYLREVEVLLGDRLAKLDEKDPTRRRADVENSEGQYITTFGDQGSRWLFGEFATTKINLMLILNRDYVDQWGRAVHNYINFYIPVSENLSAGPELDRLIRFFKLTVEKLEAFYAYSDLKEEIMTKKSHEGGAMDMATELPGVFWLTYFGPKHADFFTRERLLSIPGAMGEPKEGITIRLAASPFQVGQNDRRNAEIALGEKYFAGLEPITDFNKRKAPDQLLTFEQLRS